MPSTLKIVENGVQEEQGKCIFPEKMGNGRKNCNGSPYICIPVKKIYFSHGPEGEEFTKLLHSIYLLEISS